MSEAPPPTDADRWALLSALGVEGQSQSREVKAALEALAGEVLALRSERLSLEAQLEQAVTLADRDALCPLFNRRAFMRELAREIASAERYNTPLSLIYVDLDHFKLVNDRFGHATGDKVLKLVASIILENVRQTDIPARLGGDEFAILLTHAEYEDAVHKSAELESELRTLTIRDSSDTNRPAVQLGASCGTVAWQRGMSANLLLDNADEQMFRVKAKRKRATPSEKEALKPSQQT